MVSSSVCASPAPSRSQPDVLLMDEPCSALDPISTLAIEDLITELKKDYTIVIVTHNMQQAARVSDQTAFFNLEATGKPGQLVEIDDTEKIFSNPTAEGHRGLHLRPLRLERRTRERPGRYLGRGVLRLGAPATSAERTGRSYGQTVRASRSREKYGSLQFGVRGEVSRRRRVSGSVGQLAGDQEDDAAADLDGVVGEALVEAAEQGDVDRRRPRRASTPGPSGR